MASCGPLQPRDPSRLSTSPCACSSSRPSPLGAAGACAADLCARAGLELGYQTLDVDALIATEAASGEEPALGIPLAAVPPQSRPPAASSPGHGRLRGVQVPPRGLPARHLGGLPLRARPGASQAVEGGPLACPPARPPPTPHTPPPPLPRWCSASRQRSAQSKVVCCSTTRYLCVSPAPPPRPRGSSLRSRVRAEVRARAHTRRGVRGDTPLPRVEAAERGGPAPVVPVTVYACKRAWVHAVLKFTVFGSSPFDDGTSAHVFKVTKSAFFRYRRTRLTLCRRGFQT